MARGPEAHQDEHGALEGQVEGAGLETEKLQLRSEPIGNTEGFDPKQTVTRVSGLGSERLKGEARRALGRCCSSRAEL